MHLSPPGKLASTAPAPARQPGFSGPGQLRRGAQQRPDASGASMEKPPRACAFAAHMHAACLKHPTRGLPSCPWSRDLILPCSPFAECPRDPPGAGDSLPGPARGASHRHPNPAPSPPLLLPEPRRPPARPAGRPARALARPLVSPKPSARPRAPPAPHALCLLRKSTSEPGSAPESLGRRSRPTHLSHELALSGQSRGLQRSALRRRAEGSPRRWRSAYKAGRCRPTQAF